MQEPCNIRSKHYKWNVAAIFIFHCNSYCYNVRIVITNRMFFKINYTEKIVCTSKYPLKNYGEYFIINNIRIKLLRNFIFSLYFLLSLEFEPTYLHGENFMAIFTTPSVVIWFSTGTLGIFATLVYVFTMRVVIYDILSMAIILTLSTSVRFCNLYYIRLWISLRSVVKIAIRI